ncbi:MAG: hypothetical protein KAS16_02785 [Thermoplasmata archaeon]|nr:hypothetical protein [Thermoplasmata archaeon]
MKKAIVMFICASMLVGGIGIGFGQLVAAEGDGTATIINAAPSATDQLIYDAGWGLQTSIVPDTMFYFSVTVSDVDGIGNILNTTITLNHMGSVEDNPNVRYQFCYNEIDGAYQWAQLIPSGAEMYIIPGSCVRTETLPNDITYDFAVIMNKTAQDSNGAPSWRFSTTVRDADGGIYVVPFTTFGMGKFLEISYSGNAAGMDFSWTGTAETNKVAASFTTRVTSNDNYDLNASFTGAFDGGWGAPTLWVKSPLTAYVQLPDASAQSNLNVTWDTISGPSYNSVIVNTLALDIPAGTAPGTYTGVQIWITAIND